MNLLKKYKVENFNDIVGQDRVVKFLKSVVNNYKNYNNCYILYGEWGIGKTSLVRCFVNYFRNKYKTTNVNFYDFDSSTLNKDSIKELCNIIKNNFLFNKDRVYVILFEEIQSIIRSDTQDSLLKILEIVADNIIFFFTTTNYNKIIDAIKSRSISLQLDLLNREEINKYIDNIIEKESLDIDDKTKELIINKSSGHIRDCLQLLNLYIKDKEIFKEYLIDYKDIIYKYFLKAIDEEEISKYSVDELLKNLYYFINEYVDKNINNINKVVKILDIYFKYKYYVKDINDFIIFIKIIREFIKIE